MIISIQSHPVDLKMESTLEGDGLIEVMLGVEGRGMEYISNTLAKVYKYRGFNVDNI
jgi:hypothetical protein